jgi:hypothetical protein
MSAGTLQVARIVCFGPEYRDWDCGRDCIRRCSWASWWEWDIGSWPMHWRWPIEYQVQIRDGLPPCFNRQPDSVTIPQRGESDPVIREQVRKKLAKAQDKGYLDAGPVRALTLFFTVPKGDSDVRVVYNGTKSGLNDCLWAPWFRLPTIEQHLRAMRPGTFLADLDIGEQFHNFVMHVNLQPYAGVDVTAFFPDEFLTPATPGKRGKRTIWLRWTCCGMGFKISPYNAGQGVLFAEEVIRGNPLNVLNCFHFDEVKLNIPGAPNYTPGLPWVYKFRSDEQRIANDFFVYVDNVRATGHNYDGCWKAARAVTSRYDYLGLQDALCKRRAPSTEAVPWAGSTVHTNQGWVTVTVMVEQWRKVQQMLQWICDCCMTNPIGPQTTRELSWLFSLFKPHLSVTCTIPQRNPSHFGFMAP